MCYSSIYSLHHCIRRLNQYWHDDHRCIYFFSQFLGGMIGFIVCLSQGRSRCLTEIRPEQHWACRSIQVHAVCYQSVAELTLVIITFPGRPLSVMKSPKVDPRTHPEKKHPVCRWPSWWNSTHLAVRPSGRLAPGPPSTPSHAVRGSLWDWPRSLRALESSLGCMFHGGSVISCWCL